MPNIAFVLTGGGAKGAFQLGAMRQLWEIGIKPTAIYGSSVGAINAYGMRYLGVKGLCDVWCSIDKRSAILKFDWKTIILRSKGIYSLKPLLSLMNKYGHDAPIFDIEAVVSKVSLVSGELKYCYASKSNIEQFKWDVIGSSAIPGIMAPAGEYVDGGVREIAPLSQALKDGYRKIIVIKASSGEMEPFKVGNFISNLYRSIDDIMLDEILRNDLRHCGRMADIELIGPSKNLLDTLEFDKNKIKLAIDQGTATVMQREKSLTDKFLIK